MEELNISQAAALEFFVAAIIAVFFFRLAGKALDLVKGGKMAARLKKKLPIIEIVFWAAFLISAATAIFHGGAIFTAGIVILFLLSAIYFMRPALKDIIAGLAMKAEGAFNPGETARILDAQGTIVKTGARSIQIETQEGETVLIPYGKISGEALTRLNPSDSVKSGSRRVGIPKTSSRKAAEETLRKEIFNSPWSHVVREANIKAAGEDEKHYLFDITLYSYKEEFLNNIAGKYGA